MFKKQKLFLVIIRCFAMFTLGICVRGVIDSNYLLSAIAGIIIGVLMLVYFTYSETLLIKLNDENEIYKDILSNKHNTSTKNN